MSLITQEVRMHLSHYSYNGGQFCFGVYKIHRISVLTVRWAVLQTYYVGFKCYVIRSVDGVVNMELSRVFLVLSKTLPLNKYGYWYDNCVRRHPGLVHYRIYRQCLQVQVAISGRSHIDCNNLSSNDAFFAVTLQDNLLDTVLLEITLKVALSVTELGQRISLEIKQIWQTRKVNY